MLKGAIAKFLAAAIVLAGCVITAFIILERFENPKNEFATYREMEASGLIQAGWIPKIISRSAFQIVETHNLDTNVVRISFRFKPGDIGNVEETCHLAQTESPGFVFDCSEGTLTLSDDGIGYFTNERDE